MTLSKGLVVAHLGQGIAVEVGEQTILCQTIRKLEQVTVGDQVLISLSPEGNGRVEQILSRRSVLQRPGRNDQIRPVAANIDNVFVVLAAEPECDFLLLDQYLAICENCNIEAGMIFNKIDLSHHDVMEQELIYYQSLNYQVHRVSVIRNIGMEALRMILSDKTSMFAGQSGVGKSSLTNALIPDKDLRINSVSETTRHGRHTTTASRLYHLPGGGDLIDSPGVAIFGLAGFSEAQLAWGYREFQSLINQCRYNDCRHVNDKDCAVRAAVETGTISASRYRRFLKLREKIPSVNYARP
ncbi:MAG: ribosome small subunit-dependent GTPase A [Methylomonas sp.]|jgi:ribosome biogenesis GTPase